MTLEEFRKGQEQIAKALEQRTPGQRITILGVEGDSGTAVPRMFKARRKTVAADGTSEYVVSGMVFGSKAGCQRDQLFPRREGQQCQLRTIRGRGDAVRGAGAAKR